MTRTRLVRKTGPAAAIVVAAIAVVAVVNRSRGGAGAPASPATSPASSPAVEEARRLVDGAKYREALELISRELAVTRRGTEDVGDRADLLALKGESLLRMGNNVSAAQAFQKAAEAAASATRPDVKAA